MPVTVMETILTEIETRIAAVANTEHLGFFAGDLPQTNATAIGTPSQDAEEGEAGYERFEMMVPIRLNAAADPGTETHATRLMSLYGDVKLAIYGGNVDDIDTDLGGLAELVLEVGFDSQNEFDQGLLEADGTLTIAVTYQTALGNPYQPAT